MDSQNQITDKVFVITGGLGGIGSLVVKKLLENNAKHVAIFDINEESGYSFEEKLNQIYGDNRVKFIKCDITKEKDLKDAYEHVMKNQKYIDVLINNAAVISQQNFQETVNINVTALMSNTFIAMEHMSLENSGRGGTIINISSRLAFLKCHYYAVYSATKAAVLHFTSCLGVEQNILKTGVRFIAICFGKTNTSMINSGETLELQKSKEFLEQYELYPAQKPESAAECVITAFKFGVNGSVWQEDCDQPPEDITEQYNNGMATIAGSDVITKF